MMIKSVIDMPKIQKKVLILVVIGFSQSMHTLFAILRVFLSRHPGLPLCSRQNDLPQPLREVQHQLKSHFPQAS